MDMCIVLNILVIFHQFKFHPSVCISLNILKLFSDTQRSYKSES